MERPFCAPMMAVSRSVVGTTLAPPFAPGRRPSPARPATPTYLLVTTLDGPFSSLIAEVCPLPPAARVSPSVRRRLKCSPSHDDTSAGSALAGRCATVAPPQDAAPFVVAHAALLVFRRRALPLSPDHHASRLRTRRRLRRQDVRPLLVPRFYRHPSSGQRPHEHHPFTARDVLSSYGADWALAVFLWFFLSWFNRVEGYKREFSLEHDIRCEARPRSPWSFA
jgi:hypothetical protein